MKDRYSRIRDRAHRALGEEPATSGDIGTLYDLLDRVAAKVDGEPLTPLESEGGMGGMIVLGAGSYDVEIRGGGAAVGSETGEDGSATFKPSR